MAPNTVQLVTEKLEKPLLDDRSYRVIKLQNQLEALLVHDPETDKASASVSVDVGSFSDADDMPGMAHAVEHLLFMGTEKFPSENEYSRYLAAHSGSSNAYTASTQTNYYFEVAASNEVTDKIVNGNSKSPLYGALDRFAQFFISPLFLPSTLERELCAVDSENKKNLQSDVWRLHQLDKSLSNTKHPYHHFSTGSLATLRDEPTARGVDVRQEFMDFHAKHYSANRMKLVVLGKESLDELQEWVSELFADVKDQNLPQNRWETEQPYNEEDLQTIIFAKPVMDTRLMEMRFPFLDEEGMVETQPGRYISHLIGHEGPGSILSLLKTKGLATSLSVYPDTVCPDTGFFDVKIRLTIEGLQKYQQVVTTVFQYISMIKSEPPQKWIADEILGLADVIFKFQEKTPAGSFASHISSEMQKPYPREWLISGSQLVRKFDSQGITDAFDYLKPEKLRMMIVSQEVPGNWDQREKWYGTEYKIEKFDPAFKKLLDDAYNIDHSRRPTELHLPHKNEFVPSNLDVEKKDVESPAKAPKLIRNDEIVRIWWKKDDTFWFPKAATIVTIRDPLSFATAACFVRSRLYCELVSDALVEYAYDAEISGLNYTLNSSSTGLNVDIDGYNDKLPVLFEKILVTMRDLVVKQDRFDMIKERLTRGYQNWAFQQPYQQLSEYTNSLRRERSWPIEQMLVELESVTAEDIRIFIPQLLSQAHYEAFCFGNVYKEEALKLGKLLEDTFKPRALPQSQWPVRRNMLVEPGTDYTLRRTVKDEANVNNCISYYLHVGQCDDRVAKAKLMLFGQLAEEAAFDQLRTKEQLGYLVWTLTRPFGAIVGYEVIIQSERSNVYLEGRINAFFQTFGQRLEKMDDTEFEAHKSSLVLKRLEKVKNMAQECNRVWSYIISETYDFWQREKEVECIKALSKDDILTFFKTFIDPQSPSRAKLSIHIDTKAIEQKLSQLTSEDKTEEVGGESDLHPAPEMRATTFIDDIRLWKAGLRASAGPIPVSPLSAFEELESKL